MNPLSITTTTTNSNPNLQVGLQTIVIKPGETFVLPAGAIVQSLIYDGTIDVTSTCDNLPTPEDYKCYGMEWSSATDSSPDSVLEHNQSNVEYLKIGNVKYPINFEASDYGNIKPRLQAIAEASKGILVFESLTEDGFAKHYDFKFKFKSIAAIAPTIEMKITGVGYGYGLYVRAVEENCP